MRFESVMKKHGYERDPEREKQLGMKDAKFYGRGSTGGPDPQWRFQVVIYASGAWSHGQHSQSNFHGVVLSNIGQGNNPRNLDLHLNAFASRRLGSSATYIKKRA